MRIPTQRFWLTLMTFGALVAGLRAAEPRQTRRVLLPNAAFNHELGFCHIAAMDFGEDGDRESGNKSGLLVYEDGKPLGPAHAVHADIRTQGQGRYSHWTRNGLYMSASDNSDPRTNGRKYEVGSTNPDSTLGGLEQFAGPPQKRVEVVRASQHQYTIPLGGNLDFENAHTRLNDGFLVAFQPNLSVTIENTGDATVLWPKVIANDRANWGTFDDLLAEFTRGATNDQEKALFIWQTARDNRYHCSPLFADNEFHDPVKLFNSYGLNLCDDMGYCGCSLFKHAGLGKPKYKLDPKVRELHGHVQAEAVVDGRYQFLDIDESVFHLDRENETLIGGDKCAHDHDLVRREAHYGPVFPGWDASEANAALFGADDGAGFLALRGHEMRYALRPRERVVFRWDNVGKWACQSQEWNHRPPVFGNSKFFYIPRLTNAHYKEGIAGEKDIVPAADTGLAGVSANAELVYAVDIPWAICGGTLRAEFSGLDAKDRFALAVTLDDKTRSRVWEGAGPGKVVATVPIDEALKPHISPAKYHYAVIVSLASADARQGAVLKSLQIETDVMAAPLSLPRLRRGENRLVYTDRTPTPHEITITHQWQECHSVKPPEPPTRPLYPEPGATIRDSIVTFRWPASAGGRNYHLQVSRRPDFRVPYRPSYDVIVAATEWCVPYSGMFAPDTTYYFRLRARTPAGVWSEWSPAWNFRWDGPRVPLNVRRESVPEGILLRWDPNLRGTRPVAYDVYGSDEKGFSVHKKEYESYRRGRVPANFLGRTEQTSMLVVSAQPAHPNMNRCFYRVVAVDANGTESICSDFVEMPHPHFCSRPPTTAKAGQPFAYEPKLITSLGDVQHRYEVPNDQLWDSEKLRFVLAEGPPWLTLDPQTGRLTGTPPAPGKVAIALEASARFKAEATQRFELRVE
jgi:hypothetical protein